MGKENIKINWMQEDFKLRKIILLFVNILKGLAVIFLYLHITKIFDYIYYLTDSDI